ncbi:esterase-like activity of phytase family protein [Crocosphaera sp. UHCC 0190]|uniref:esterase-like activity of phytase family protein n=1 Tax=Crocosphaera sp. UHCC 0190 TaxID=3110246 RepID=UPI002B1FA3F0|nr:esterase-like activity of phytase family protein [Crocosphaera sp. UHCC 0190]MEA5510461.1 esterase-like activity of phytase family protein [Crocosphaera sp. UHCC 0190]
MPQVRAEQRLFPSLSLEFLGEYQLPKQIFQETAVGGLSAITYNRQIDRFYALSDDRSQKAPARFYTLKIDIAPTDDKPGKIQAVTVEDVTFLKSPSEKTYAPQTIDPEGIALSPRGTVFISSEGAINKDIAPLIGEFDLKTGQIQQQVPLPQKYLPAKQPDESPRGVENNLGFEPLTISATSTLKDDPFRLFTATEASLKQDTADTPPVNIPVRLLHYVISPIGPPVLIAEHLYLLDETPKGALANGLTELLALPQEGTLLSLERTFGLFGHGAKLFQVVNSSASETSNIESFKEGIAGIKPLKKKLLLDLQELGIELDNLEGMTLGPRLKDGSQTLILISDDNFSPEQVTQLLLFQLR